MNRFHPYFWLLAGGLVSTLLGCASPRPMQVVNQVNHMAYGPGLYQLKATGSDQAMASVQWQTRASQLCPAGFNVFDVTNAIVLDPRQSDPSADKTKAFLGGGLIGLAMQDSAQNNSTVTTGYLLCNDSGLDIATARSMVYGR